MAGIYLHIPFCRKACNYCNFHFSTLVKYKPAVVRAIAAEIAQRASFFPGSQPLSTLYFGGGTPGMLDPDELHLLVETLHRNFDFAPGFEFTLEANPDDLEPEKIKEFIKAGINRLSIGIQSFRDQDLVLMKRTHNAAQSLSAIKRVQDAGITNLNLDLIYGLPQMTPAEWEAQLRRFESLGAQHLSAYALTVEEGTLLSHQVNKKAVNMPEDETVNQHFLLLMQWAESSGFTQYEISNFAQEGFHSRHNSAYWKGEPYLGLGPSAHSFLHPVRSWNVANNAAYLRALESGGSPLAGSETLTPEQQLNESLMLNLRLREGLRLHELKNKWNYVPDGEVVAHLLSQKWIILTDETLQLTPAGKLVADHITALLLPEDQE